MIVPSLSRHDRHKPNEEFNWSLKVKHNNEAQHKKRFFVIRNAEK